MARPIIIPDWATAAAYPAGVLDWSGQPPRVQPPAGVQVQGLTPATDVPAEYLNSILGNHGDWINYLDAAMTLSAFGDGSDGNVTIAGTVHLVRDMFYANLTVPAGALLYADGFRIFVRGTLTTSGGGQINGGAIVTPGTLAVGFNGGAGNVNAAGSAGTSQTQSFGGAGGAGGTGAGGAGGAGGAVTAPAATAGSPRAWSPSTAGYIFGGASGGAAVTQITPGASGGAGGGAPAQAGGHGGFSGCFLCVAAYALNLASAGDLQAGGQAGFVSPGGNAGGGGGGGGGILIICYYTKNAATFSAATNCPGGAGGAGTGTGLVGVAGGNGTVFEFALGSGTGALPVGQVHIESGLATFATGGSGAGFDYVDVVFAVAFANATYGTSITMEGPDDVTALPGANIRLKTTTGFRIRPDAQFAGTVSWRAAVPGA